MNGLALFDWDELNFAEIAREMLLTGDWLTPTINFAPFYEKPPMFSWLQLAAFRLFGATAFAARIPNVVCAFFTAAAMYYHGRKQRGGDFAFFWLAFFLFSLLPQLYFRSGIIDPWFNLFTFLGLLPALEGGEYGWRELLFGSFFLGLAVLTKGPAAGLIAGCCWAYLLITAARKGPFPFRKALSFLATGLLALLPILIWLAVLWRQGEANFAGEFLRYQWRLFSQPDAGHGGFPGYHVVVLLLGCFPASAFALPALLRFRRYDSPSDRGMRLLFWVVLILFSIVSTKIVHYSSLCYFPLAWFAARVITAPEVEASDLARSQRLAFIVWGLYALAALTLPLIAWNLDEILPRLRDPELVSRLELVVRWPAYTLFPGIIILSGSVWLYFMRGQSIRRKAGVHLAVMVAFVPTALAVFAPRIQAYSQGAAVDFYRNLAQREVSVGTAYYKSYAHWFYAAIPPDRYAEGCQDRQCRFHGRNPLPLYFSSPLRKTEQVLREVPDAELLYQRGGFSFYSRPAAVEK